MKQYFFPDVEWSIDDVLNIQRYYSRKSNAYVPALECLTWYFNRGLITLNDFVELIELGTKGGLI